jgi:hypothetical protein
MRLKTPDMGKLTWDEAVALVRRASRPWGMVEDLHPAIEPVKGFDQAQSRESSEFAKRILRNVRRAMKQADSAIE